MASGLRLNVLLKLLMTIKYKKLTVKKVKRLKRLSEKNYRLKNRLKDLNIMKIQRLTTKRLNFTNYKLYLALKIFLKSHLKILQGMGFLKKLGRVVQH